MLIGILADSHDHLPYIKKAIAFFLEHKVEKIVHCGDIVAPFINRSLTALKGTNIEMIGVFGNNDGERDHMNRLLGDVMSVKGDFIEVCWGGKNIAIYHGTILPLNDALIQSQKYDLVLSGHTHEIHVEKIKNTLFVNPGEVCGYLTGNPTCAIIDLSGEKLDTENVKIWNLDKEKEEKEEY
jgi:hypothetical protein